MGEKEKTRTAEGEINRMADIRYKLKPDIEKLIELFVNLGESKELLYIVGYTASSLAKTMLYVIQDAEKPSGSSGGEGNRMGEKEKTRTAEEEINVELEMGLRAVAESIVDSKYYKAFGWRSEANNEAERRYEHLKWWVLRDSEVADLVTVMLAFVKEQNILQEAKDSAKQNEALKKLKDLAALIIEGMLGDIEAYMDAENDAKKEKRG